MRAADVIEDLGNAEITSDRELRDFVLKFRKLCRELSWHLHMQADFLQSALRTLPTDGDWGGLSSKARAWRVAHALRVAANAVTWAGRNGVKAFALFTRYFAPNAGLHKKKPTFRLEL